MDEFCSSLMGTCLPPPHAALGPRWLTVASEIRETYDQCRFA
jgi:hypothetical protein